MQTSSGAGAMAEQATALVPRGTSAAWMASWDGLRRCPMASCLRPWSVPSVIVSGSTKA
jgi:hypothetical protein